MEKHLTADFEEACFLVDLSNVVRRQDLGEPGLRSLRRLALVVDAAAELARDPDVKLYLVADRSLRAGGRREFTDPADLRMLAKWVRQGLVEELGDADERVLELCEMTGIPVISGDRYRDARDEYPFLQGNTDDFLEPMPGPGGTVRLVPLDMGVASAVQISRKKEESVLKKQGLLGPQRRPRSEIVRRNWRCPEPRCTLYDSRKGAYAMLPRMRRGEPTCEQHGLKLINDGPRIGTAQVKLMIADRVAARFTLEDESTVRIGRAPGPGGIALHDLLPARSATRVSRAHVEIRVSGGVVRVTDVSSFGTRWRPTAGKTGPGPWRELAKGTWRDFHAGDELQLAEGILLTRSGRRFPTELAQQWQRGTPPPDEASAAETRMY
ncbi:FHA domain-containing protein [Streptomyces odontomachi]|uniref:FHA domain-containing protein n=1 Tax=Streptomyces odontomachi TaxID=2944940 RepID=UPI00210E184A|nr:FHA domain-containing protein [Streptomyces sp. ODS25]